MDRLPHFVFWFPDARPLIALRTGAVAKVRDRDQFYSPLGLESAGIAKDFQVGVNDYLSRPIDRNEMLARVKTQIRRKRFSDRLRDNVQQSIEMAITDGLTGLYNRRYMEDVLERYANLAERSRSPMSVLMIDLDGLKRINDRFGHGAGDDADRRRALQAEFERAVSPGRARRRCRPCSRRRVRRGFPRLRACRPSHLGRRIDRGELPRAAHRLRDRRPRRAGGPRRQVRSAK